MTERETRKEDIDYTAEGSNPGEKKPLSDTDQGYDEAAHSGSGYGVPEGEGGVFGTTGGGTYGGGMQIVERPLVYEKKDDEKS